MAVGLLTLVLVTLIAAIITTLQSSEKANLLGPATQVSESLMNRTLYQVTNDVPAGTKASFWAASGVWRGPITETIGGVDYEYVISATTLNDADAGGPLGGPGAGNRVKRVDIAVNWWNSRATNSRQGQGKMQVTATRLVNEDGP